MRVQLAVIPLDQTPFARLIARCAAILRKVTERNLIVAINAVGIPEIRVPDTHPGRGQASYSRPIMRIVVNGEDAQPPTDLRAFADLVATAPELIAELQTTLIDAQAKLAELHNALAHADQLPIADENQLQTEVRKALWDFRDAGPGAQANRAIDLIRRYLPAPEIIERERIVAVERTLISKDEYRRLHAAIVGLKIVDDELVDTVAIEVLSALNLVVQEAKLD